MRCLLPGAHVRRQGNGNSPHIMSGGTPIFVQFSRTNRADGRVRRQIAGYEQYAERHLSHAGVHWLISFYLYLARSSVEMALKLNLFGLTQASHRLRAILS